MQSARFCWRKASNCSIRRNAKTYSTAVEHQQDAYNAIVHAGSRSECESNDGPLKGKVVVVKDNIVTKDVPTTAASKILASYTPSYDATVVKLLRDHGATVSTKTNLDEFGMGSHSQNSDHGPTLSPYSRAGQTLSPGGSSGGSAVAVATGTAWAAIGTDTGGSVRLPAAYSGVVGFKASYGLLSRWGVMQYANSLDTVGIFGQNVDDVRQLFRILDVYDKHDPTSLAPSVRRRLSSSGYGSNLRSLRIGVPSEYNILELSPLMRTVYCRTLSSLQAAGHTIHNISLPSTRQALSAYYILAPAEASSNLAKYDGVRYGYRTSGPPASSKEQLPLYAKTRGEGFGAEVQRRILLGAYTLSSEAIDNYFIKAQKVRRLVQRDFDRVFASSNPLLGPGDLQDSGVDLILTPTAPTLPPTLAEVRRQTPVESYMNDVFTVPASLAGLPAVSVPVALSAQESEGMDENDIRSVGMQIIGQFGSDQAVLDAASIVERL